MTLDLLWKDIRFGLRTLLRNPATTAVALLALALGIGANSAIFSVVNGVLLEPLPFSRSDELVLVWENHPGRSIQRASVAPPNFNDWRQQARSFAGMAAMEQVRLNLTGRERPEVLPGAAVSAGFFRILGAPMLAGREFTPEEDRPGAGRVVVLSEGLWRRLFAADPQILGRTVPLSGEPYTVVGVASALVDLPNNSQLWVPLAQPFAPEDRGAHSLRVLGRLKTGVSLERAQAEMSAIAARLARQYPDTNEGWGALVMPLRESIVQNIRPILLILLGAVAFVLLIACANVANLLLARVASREREIAVRTALGAGRWRLMRQMLTESAVLFLGGGLLGLLLAYWGTRVLVAMSPDGVIPRAAGIGLAIGLDGRVLLFTFGISLLTGLLFGLVPALHATGGPLQPSLKEGGRSQSGGLRGRWVRNALVLAEVSVALMLLVGAGLLIQSFSRLRAVDPGMRAEGVLTAQIALAEAKYPEEAQQTAFFRQLLERLRAMPGVESAASIFPLPLSGSRFVLVISIEGRPAPDPNDVPTPDVASASPGYFRTAGIPLLDGRDFTFQDTEASQPVIIINQTMARRLWPGESPLGKRITFDDVTAPDPEWRTIVGVVGDVRNKDLGEEPGMQTYWPQLQTPITSAVLLVRTTGREPESLAAALREAVAATDRDLPIDQVRTLEEVISRVLALSRFKTVLLGLFAGLALVLAAVGVYGVISYSVAQRTHEIGIRMALGAHRGQVLRMVVRQGMGLVAAGVLAGLVLAWFAVRLLTDQVYGVSPSDPATFALVPLVLLAVALLANYLPARRATRVDPLEALRYE